MEFVEDNRKKFARDYEALLGYVEGLKSENDKLNKSKKKLQSEVDDLNVEPENQRAQYSAMEKKQCKFDQNLVEESHFREVMLKYM